MLLTSATSVTVTVNCRNTAFNTFTNKWLGHRRKWKSNWQLLPTVGSNDVQIESDVDHVELFRLTLGFVDYVSTSNFWSQIAKRK